MVPPLLPFEGGRYLQVIYDVRVYVFLAARGDARITSGGEICPLEKQDRKSVNQGKSGQEGVERMQVATLID